MYPTLAFKLPSSLSIPPVLWDADRCGAWTSFSPSAFREDSANGRHWCTSGVSLSVGRWWNQAGQPSLIFRMHMAPHLIQPTKLLSISAFPTAAHAVSPSWLSPFWTRTDSCSAQFIIHSIQHSIKAHGGQSNVMLCCHISCRLLRGDWWPQSSYARGFPRLRAFYCSLNSLQIFIGF